MSRPSASKRNLNVGGALLQVAAAQEASVVERLRSRTQSGGTFSGPCLPSLCAHYLSKLQRLFGLIDRPLSAPEFQRFSAQFRETLESGYRASPYARFLLDYRPSASNPQAIDCSLSVVCPTLEEQYAEWLAVAGGSEPFGAHPDAKVLELGRELPPEPARVLDVGAGSGRNALALARLGWSVDALEPLGVLANALRNRAAVDSLPLRVLEQDLLAETTALAPNRYALIVLSEVVTHFSAADLQLMLRKLAPALSRDGRLLFNAFVAQQGYVPGALASQAAQCVWSTFFLPEDVSGRLREAGLELVSDEGCVAYERAHLPASAWPPTSWYESWASGHNLFSAAAGPAPIELRWLVARGLCA